MHGRLRCGSAEPAPFRHLARREPSGWGLWPAAKGWSRFTIGCVLASCHWASCRRNGLYSPHLTIARVKDIRPSHAAALRKVLRDADDDVGECQVASATIFRSRPTPTGSQYQGAVARYC